MIPSEYETGIPSCNCDKSQYCYAPHNHVITGDLNIITNENPSKGPNYKEQIIIIWNINKKIIVVAIDKYATKWCKEKRPLVGQF